MVCNSIGMGIGGPFGGFISDCFGWRWAFLAQIPLFCFAFLLVTFNLRYSNLDGKSVQEMSRRIDFTGTAMLFGSVLCFLLFLSYHANDYLPWRDPLVYWPFSGSLVLAVLFLAVELRFAQEPVLAPFLLCQRVPFLIGISNFCVAMCNFSVLYYFPMWFRTVRLDSAGRAGSHLIPNGVSFSVGSLLAGWLIHYMGTYKKLDLVFGSFPIMGTILLCQMHESSPPFQLWFSIVPLGFGNAVALQAMTIARLAHLPTSCVAVGTGFCQLFRGLGQVSGVAVASAIFQAELNDRLWERIHGPDAEKIIKTIRRSAKAVRDLPPDLQRVARDAYAESIHKVFIFAVCAAVAAYIVRLPIPDKDLEDSREEEGSQA